MTFDSGLLFEVGSAGVQAPARANLEHLATILQKYPDTDILIEGHTDATGSEEFNLTLSQQRAQAVANQLAALQVSTTRFTIMGYGESQPIADNATAEGRAQNRRVELAIMANDKLKDVAAKQAG
ncbi:MAG: OmpA family protein [Candidatus Krumholzibacteriia bacterium]